MFRLMKLILNEQCLLRNDLKKTQICSSASVHRHNIKVKPKKWKPIKKSFMQHEYNKRNIYCHGSLLHIVQMASIYQDSKTFVDLKLKYPPSDTMKRFNEFMEQHGLLPDRMAIKTFVNNTFDPAGSEFEEWIPEDWKAKPAFLDKFVKNETLRDWGYKLNGLWKILGRKLKEDVERNQELYSIIWVPRPVIVPGGRFRELYYWDSYWIIKGLLLCEMFSTAKGMLENFLFMIDKYGFIPNGGRIYYCQRSQPPLLIPTMKIYKEFTDDTNFIKNNLHLLDKEFEFWMNNHTVNISIGTENYKLAVYGDKSIGPRPESYREDIDSARIFQTDQEKEAYFSELKAAAESGWDFSSRWFILHGTNEGSLTNLATRSIVPVDLNSFIYGNAIILSEFHEMMGDTSKVNYYKTIASQWLEAVSKVLWHEEYGAWLDFDLISKTKRKYFYPTNICPLWTGCYDKSKKRAIIRKIRSYIRNTNMMTYSGGIPTTFEHSGEQWDFPNAWSPLQHMVIEGLESTEDPYSKIIAYELANKWVHSNFKAFQATGAMFEKYDATVFGGYGAGGEYEIQIGFGWTNGIILDFLYKYGHRLSVDENIAYSQPHVKDIEIPNSNKSDIE